MPLATRIPPDKLRFYQARYDTSADPKLDHIRTASRSQGYITVSQLHEIALWKSRRRAALTKANREKLVREITSFSFGAACEESKIGSLTLLKGVQYPTASVILHFCVSDTYPILDFRAIWSLGIEQPAAYGTDFWLKYMGTCRSIANKYSMSVRELDMALWQYSSEHQA